MREREGGSRRGHVANLGGIVRKFSVVHENLLKFQTAPQRFAANTLKVYEQYRKDLWTKRKTYEDETANITRTVQNV